MNALPIYTASGQLEQTVIRGWRCTKCNSGWSNDALGGRKDAAKSAAEQCCVPRVCDTCGADYGRCDYCQQCADARSDARQATLFEAAAKIPEHEYDGPVCYNDDWHSSIDALRDELAASELPVPKFVWATRPFCLKLSAEEILSHALDEHYEGAFGALEERGAVKALQLVLDEWGSGPGHLESLREDVTRAVMLDQTDESEDDDKPYNSAEPGGLSNE